jgi:hypothetical protein
MAERMVLDCMMTVKQPSEAMDTSSMKHESEPIRPSISHSLSNSIPLTYGHVINDGNGDLSPSDESRYKVEDVIPTIARPSNCYSHSTVEESLSDSRSSSPRPCLSSTATSPSLDTVESFSAAPSVRSRISMLRRLKSSTSTVSAPMLTIPRRLIEPSNFRTPAEIPEKRFVDSIGVVCPGVSDRNQCVSLRAHFVSTFRMLAPIEYTTALADHGLTYTDYCRLLTSLGHFLESIVDTKVRVSQDMLSSLSRKQRSIFGSPESVAMRQPRRRSRISEFSHTTEQLEKAKRQAEALSQLLEEITSTLRARGLPVVICVSSFSLFAPYRVSETHIQILHEPLARKQQSISPTPDARSGQRLSFLDPFAFAGAPRSVDRSRPKLENATHTQSSKHRHQTCRTRDYSQP